LGLQLTYLLNTWCIRFVVLFAGGGHPEKKHMHTHTHNIPAEPSAKKTQTKSRCQTHRNDTQNRNAQKKTTVCCNIKYHYDDELHSVLLD